MTVGKTWSWLNAGSEAFSAMLEAIAAAQSTIRFETYIYANDQIGEKFRDALVRARARGVAVKVLIDAVGSFTLPGDYWKELIHSGGEAKLFNPIGPRRFEFRNHRKLLVCDNTIAFVGGFNVAKEYEGDGVQSGWRDLGLRVTNGLAGELAASFDEMFAHADFQHKRFKRSLLPKARGTSAAHGGELLLMGPGRGRNPFKQLLRHDLARAHDVKIIAAYFLPTWQIRRELVKVVKRGGRVQLILPGKSDIFLSQMACHSLYRRFLRAGVEIYEYQPQILHAKLILIDDKVYAGSANLDPRSFQINFELMLRLQHPALVAEARQMFAKDLSLCHRVELEAWRKSRTWWKSLRQRWAYFILAQLDPIIARWQYRGMLN